MKTDVVIIGAGPAGTVCAYLLKKAGVDCILVDRVSFPRDKICGGGLTVKAYRLLEEIMPGLQYDYQSIRKARLTIENRTACEIVPAEELRIVRRVTFDDALLQQYLQIGGAFEKAAFSTFEVQDDGRILVTMRSGKQILCDYLVGADGANSRVRHQLIGDYDGNVLFLEQYVEKSRDVIDGELSGRLKGGYYYLFPNKEFDIVGYGGYQASVVGFRELLAEKKIKETKIKGAYIPVKEVESGNDHIILIGDAGGFPNKVTYEGLYYAFATAKNAYLAIKNVVSFRETNKEIFKKKKRERLWAKLFYSRLGLLIVKDCAPFPKVVKWIFDKSVS